MSALEEKVSLGRSGLRVSRLGIGSSFGVSDHACQKAFDHGVNYFFWGSVRTEGMASAIRHIARHHREDLVVVLESYARALLVERSVEQGLRQLGLDHVDVLLLGWHDTPPSPRLLRAVEDLRRKGRFRCLGLSSHHRPLFRALCNDRRFDVFHVRYNAAHPGAENDVFPYLGDDGPGVVSFTNTRWGDLLEQKNMPPGFSAPSAADCYRFALSNPHVHVATCGPKSDEEMDAALEVLKLGPMGPDDLDRMRRVGEHVHGIRSFMATFT